MTHYADNAIAYLHEQDLLDLHTFAVLHYGGLLGIKSQDRLQAVLAAPHRQMFSTELYPDLCSKVAALTFLLLKSHPFVGANNATGLLAMLRFLAINGMVLHPAVDSTAVARVIRHINDGDLDREGLEAWLRENIAPAPQP